MHRLTPRLSIFPLSPAQMQLWVHDLPALEAALGCTYRGEPLSGPFLQSADALIPEHIPIPSFGDKALKLRMIQTGAGYGEDRAVCFSGQHGQEGLFTKRS